MRLGLLSDCHLESRSVLMNVFSMLPAPGSVDVFLLAGDATRGEWAFELCEMIHEHLGCPVLFTPGNHEYYNTHDLHCTMDEMEALWLSAFANHAQIHYLQNSSITIGEISFFGSTWWSNFRAWGSERMQDALELQDLIADFMLINTHKMNERESKERLSDLNRKSSVFRGQQAYENIGKSFHHKIDVKTMMELNINSLKIYKSWFGATPGTKVLMTHFPMLLGLQHIKYPPHPYFVSNDDLILERLPPDLLVFGHTHCNYNKMVNGIKCVSNQFGYGHEYTNYDPNMIIEI
jgi:predicted phosphodiesterase